MFLAFAFILCVYISLVAFLSRVNLVDFGAVKAREMAYLERDRELRMRANSESWAHKMNDSDINKQPLSRKEYDFPFKQAMSQNKEL